MDVELEAQLTVLPRKETENEPVTRTRMMKIQTDSPGAQTTKHACSWRVIQIAPDGQGYFRGILDRVPAGSRYRYRLNGDREFPDPPSRSQPESVRGPSELIAGHFEWQDASRQGIPLRNYILYELHIGAFTAEGTFDAAISHLDYLADLGVTALEIMPVPQFPGGRNWGYDGIYPFAVQSTYGGPAGLKRLVNAAHARGLAVVLDVVYNHLA